MPSAPPGGARTVACGTGPCAVAAAIRVVRVGAPGYRRRRRLATAGSGGLGSSDWGCGLISGGPTATRLPSGPIDSPRRRRQILGWLIVLRQKHLGQIRAAPEPAAR